MITINSYPEGATPLDPDEMDGLIPKHISTLAQLNEWEQRNILAAENEYSQKNLLIENILTTEFIKKIHQKMFNKTWKWAGQFRKTEKNIGVDPFYISVSLKSLLDDVKFQIENETYLSMDEVIARFHHRLVSIHPFPNGNGRHARFVSDLLLISLNQPRFTWGDLLKNEISDKEIRKKYIYAVQAADKQNYKFLIEFVRQ